MSSVNQGQQQISWKYSTPLQAEYLNSGIAGFSSQGLCIRPKLTVNPSSNGALVTISKFSVLIEPEDEMTTDTDRDDIYQEKGVFNLVKITTTQTVSVQVTSSDVAIGVRYTFANNGIPQSQWFADIIPLSKDDVANFKGVIIATVQTRQGNTSQKWSVTTNGADISDNLLREEGWNPIKWVSLISPRRIVQQESYESSDLFNKLEIRCHNNSYNGYMNGHTGCVKHSAPTIELPAQTLNGLEFHDTGAMVDRYNLVSLNTQGMQFAEHSHTLPISKTRGSVLAILDCTEQTSLAEDTFSNRVKIMPVESEDLNVYLDSEILYVK